MIGEVNEVLEGKDSVSVEDLEQLQYTEQVHVLNYYPFRVGGGPG